MKVCLCIVFLSVMMSACSSTSTKNESIANAAYPSVVMRKPACSKGADGSCVAVDLNINNAECTLGMGTDSEMDRSFQLVKTKDSTGKDILGVSAKDEDGFTFIAAVSFYDKKLNYLIHKKSPPNSLVEAQSSASVEFGQSSAMYAHHLNFDKTWLYCLPKR